MGFSPNAQFIGAKALLNSQLTFIRWLKPTAIKLKYNSAAQHWVKINSNEINRLHCRPALADGKQKKDLCFVGFSSNAQFIGAKALLDFQLTFIRWLKRQ